jgi:hypothetical protein
VTPRKWTGNPLSRKWRRAKHDVLNGSTRANGTGGGKRDYAFAAGDRGHLARNCPHLSPRRPKQVGSAKVPEGPKLEEVEERAPSEWKTSSSCSKSRAGA